MIHSIILIAGLFLRLWGVQFGLPLLTHQDEPILVNHAMLLAATGDPGFYIIPPFTMYVLAGAYGCFFAAGKVSGIFSGTDAFAAYFVANPETFYLTARILLGVIPGIAAVWLVMKIAGRFFSRRTGILAGAMLAVSHINVQHSHYAYADTAVTFAVLTLIYFVFRACESGRIQHYLLAGASLGWAVSIKYTALYFSVPLLAVFFAVHRRELFSSVFWRRFLAAALSSAAAFCLMVPYFWLNFGTFMEQIHRQSGAEVSVGWGHHLFYSLTGGLGYFILSLAVIGTLSGLKVYRKWALILSANIIFYYVISVFFSQHFARYVLPITPMLILLAAAGLDALLPHIKSKKIRMIFVALGFLSAVLPTICSDMILSSGDTRSAAKLWVESRLAAGSSIAVDNKFFSPGLSQTSDQIMEKYDLAKQMNRNNESAERKIGWEIKAAEQHPQYRVYYVSEHPEAVPDLFLMNNPQIAPSLDSLRMNGVRYLITNSISPNKHLKSAMLLNPRQFKLLYTASPFRGAEDELRNDPYSTTAIPHMFPDLIKRKKSGPELKIYEVLQE